jgi:hypothetical protein
MGASASRGSGSDRTIDDRGSGGHYDVDQEILAARDAGRRG